MAFLTSLGKYRDSGLLILRIGLGLSFLFLHGYPKLAGGPEMWKMVGGAMANVGMDFYPEFWGFMAGLVEAAGGLLLLLGFLFRPAAFFLAMTMLVAAINHLAAGEGLAGASHPLELMLVFIALLLIGPGKYSVDKR